jgi:phage repressor protein C with HTH and peptisase S24 domain
MGWSLARLAEAAGCSKAYLSAIENGKVMNPPSGRMVGALEGALGLGAGELGRLAEWRQTPANVRAEYRQLVEELSRLSRRADGAMNLDALYRSGALGRGVRGAEEAEGNVQVLAGMGVMERVPVINKVAAGYPKDFTDMGYPARVADEYVAAVGVDDGEAFAARVVGASMEPEYREGDIVVFSPAREPVDGSDCFVRLLPDHEATFKRVYLESDQRVRLVPLNRCFEERVVAMEDVAGMYMAVMRIQKIMPVAAGAKQRPVEG